MWFERQAKQGKAVQCLSEQVRFSKFAEWRHYDLGKARAFYEEPTAATKLRTCEPYTARPGLGATGSFNEYPTVVVCPTA